MKKIFFSLVMALSIVSCSTDELSSGGNGSQKGIQLVLSTDGFDEIGSRTVDESAIHDVNILEYKKGALVKQVYLDKDDGVDFSKAVEVSGLEDFDATLLDNKASDTEDNAAKNGIENFIFVVANYGKQIGSDQVSPLATLEDFKMEFTGKKDLAYLPMTGFYYGGINANSTTQMNVTLQRAVAKVSFTLDTSSFKVGGKTPSLLVVNSIKLCNVPNEVTLYPKQPRPSLPINGGTVNWNSTEDATHIPFPTASEMDNSVTYDDAQNQSSDANTYVAYIPENVRGSYSNITNNKDKHPSNCDISEEAEEADKSYTYILVDLTYASSDGIGRRATYRIYLGGNSTGDMNLLRNTQYNVNTSLYGANSADTRISVITDETKGTVLEPANCYMVDMDDVASGNNQLFIPLSQVTKGWEKIVEYDTTTETAALKTKVDEMLKSGKWTIKTLWKTWSGTNSVTGIIAAGSKDDKPIARLAIPTNIENGNNAVVELVSTEDNTAYWSWHLWFTDYKPSATDGTAKNGKVHQYSSDLFQTGIYKNRYIMDRNLGATITKVSESSDIVPTTADAIKYNGLFYQFGRKDPFIGANATSGTSFADCYDAGVNNMPTPAASAENVSGSTSFLAKAVMNPTTFYKASTGNWTKEKTGLWSDLNGSTEVDKSVFDPCPPGWRVPVNGTWDNSFSNWSPTGVPGRRYTGNSVNAWYPATGYLLYSSGELNAVGVGGYSWSVTPRSNQTNYYYLDVNSSRVYTSGNERGGFMTHAFPVRCIQDRE